MADFWSGFICGFFNLFGTNCTVSNNSSLRYKMSGYLMAAMKYYKNEYKKIGNNK
jgi:hypothetical protein